MSSEASHEADYKVRVQDIGETQFLPETSIELVQKVNLDEPPRFAVFDFDGTLSCVREGWPEIMIPMMVEELAKCGTDDQIVFAARSQRRPTSGAQGVEGIG